MAEVSAMPSCVPVEIETLVQGFPECHDRLKDQHRSADDGRCYTCGDISPCEYEQWLHTIPAPQIPQSRQALTTQERPWHHASPIPVT